MRDSNLRPAEPERFETALPDGMMAGLLWPRPDAPRLVFCHANGFNARTYTCMLAPLAERYEVVAFDLRGHGRTALPADPKRHRHWRGHAADIAAAIGRLEPREWIGAGHSMGATSLLMASPAMNRPPRALALIEPVILPRAAYLTAHTPLWRLAAKRMDLVQGALRRRGRFASQAEVLERYRQKPSFARWADGVLEDYLADGLTRTTDGVKLACDPLWEAANFAAQRHWPLKAARRYAGPISILKAERGSTVLNPKAVIKAGAALTSLSGAGHLAPLEKPESCARWLQDTMAAAL